MNIAERSKLWLEAKAHAELDGLILPPSFVAEAEGYITGTTTLNDLVRCYESLLPDKETLRLMFEQYDSGYMDLKMDDPDDLQRVKEALEGKTTEEITSNGMSVKNLMGMEVALAYLLKHGEKTNGKV